MSNDDFGLPCNLEDGLVLRWAGSEDAEAVAEFNVGIHSDDPDEPQLFLSHWTRDLMSGGHPTTKANDFTVVIDENEGGKIVSSMNLISQTWAYDGIPFGVGRPELVGTDEKYRRRGLVRAQFEAIHAKSAARGELVLGITGIPWYYRQFGYEMGLNLGGNRRYRWPTDMKPVENETLQKRTAVPGDLPRLKMLNEIHYHGSLMTRVFDQEQWRYELFGAHRESPQARHVYILGDMTGAEIGYVEYRHWGQNFLVRELAVLPGHSLRAACLFLTRALKAEADHLKNKKEKPVNQIIFNLGAAHPVYKALDRELSKPRTPYAWFIRVPDVPGFLHHITPALEKRLASSVMAGHTGKLKLSFYHEQLMMTFEQGKLTAVSPYQPKNFFDCDAFFPDLTFLQLLFGYRSLDELDQARADCYADNAEGYTLLKCLFPKQPSWISPLG